ncbi:MAG: CHAP domain-containing protein [Novosphingobium sp.]
MRVQTILAVLTASAALALPAGAVTPPEAQQGITTASAGMHGYLQCVPYARQLTGIRIFGDAHTWWQQAEGRYARGSRPKVGAVMNFRPYGNSELGHVAAVSRIVDKRTVLVSHANWSPINGQRGQIEDNVRVIDVSPDNDWSEVRVWFAPINGLGTTHWPLYGFIYPEKPGATKQASKAAPETLPPTAVRLGDDPIGDIIRTAQSARRR